MYMKIKSFSSKKEADYHLASDMLMWISSNYQSTQPIIIAVSGGNTPMEMYHRLALGLEKFVDEHTISQVIIVQVDERFVPTSHQRANQAQLKEIFRPPLEFVPILTPDREEDLGEATDQTAKKYQDLLD